MNLPNKLTMLRVIMIPVFVALMLLSRSDMVIDYMNRQYTLAPYIWLS